MKIVITAGPTAEDIDAVRFITNRSSGRMGYTIAETAVTRRHDVTLISGPVALPPVAGAAMVSVRSAREMCRAVLDALPSHDVLIMSAAVADYTPADEIPGKHHKDPASLDGDWLLRLVRTPDILMEVRAHRRADQIIVGFSLEPELDDARAADKLRAKRLDAIVVNDVSSFGSERGRFRILFRDLPPLEVGEADKTGLADILLRRLESWPG